MSNTRQATRRLISELPYDAIPEMVAPTHTVPCRPFPGCTRELEMRPDAPFFNASTYCNHLNLRFALWMRHPATIALIHALGNYYREAARETKPELIMQVKSGARCVHGYYVHIMLHDALSAWCDFMLTPEEYAPRIPNAAPSSSARHTPLTPLASSIPVSSATPSVPTGTTTLVYSRRTRTSEEDPEPAPPHQRIAELLRWARSGPQS